MNADYVKNQTNGSNPDMIKIFGGGLSAQVAPHLVFVGDYWKNNADGAKALNRDNAPKAYVTRLAWRGNNATVPGSWGLAVEYLKAEPGSISGDLSNAQVLVGGTNNLAGEMQGIKAWDFQVHYTLAKNVTFDGLYQFNIKDTLTGNDYENTNGSKLGNYTRMQINYFF